MAASWARWATPLRLGIAVLLLSLPLATGRPAPSAAAAATLPAPTPAVAAAAAPLVAVLGERATRPAVTIVERAVPAAELAPAEEASAAPVPQVPAAAAVRANWISIGRLGLSQPVGWYTDCQGQAPVPRWGTWRWNCSGANNTYILAHNPGVFTPILGLRPGDAVQYTDPAGVLRTYRVISTTIVNNTDLWPLDGTSGPTLTLQTCWTWDGSRDFIVRAVPA